jgi:hypothetical protein
VPGGLLAEEIEVYPISKPGLIALKLPRRLIELMKCRGHRAEKYKLFTSFFM